MAALQRLCRQALSTVSSLELNNLARPVEHGTEVAEHPSAEQPVAEQSLAAAWH